jgi:hypothetical protein
MSTQLPPAEADPGPGLTDRLIGIVIVLVTNAIPIYGVFRLGWSVTNVLVLFWLENLLVAIFTCARIALHRHLTNKSGHWRSGQIGSTTKGKPASGSLLGEYAIAAFVFTFGHGVFVAAIAFLLAQKQPGEAMWHFSSAAFKQGALMLAVVLAVDFVTDLPGLGSRSFAWIKTYAQQRMGRVLVLHLAIIFGMVAMAVTESPLGLLYVLIGLKTLWDLAAASAVAAPVADTPPGWLVKLGDRVGKKGAGRAEMAAQWTSNLEASRKQAIEDEKVVRA